MKVSMIRECCIDEVPVGEYFMRGRSMYQVTGRKGRNILARKMRPIKLSYIVLCEEKKVDAEDFVMQVNLQDYKIAQNEKEIS